MHLIEINGKYTWLLEISEGLKIPHCKNTDFILNQIGLQVLGSLKN